MSNKILFPAGSAFFPALFEADTRFDQAGMYKADVVLDPGSPETAEVMTKLTATWKAHVGSAPTESKNPMWEVKEDGIHFKIRAKNKVLRNGDLWDRKPALIDAEKKAITESFPIWSGSTIRPLVEVYEWATPKGKGVSLQPVVVQVIEVVAGETDTSMFDSYDDGFKAEDGGVANDVAAFDGDPVADDAAAF